MFQYSRVNGNCGHYWVAPPLTLTGESLENDNFGIAVSQSADGSILLRRPEMANGSGHVRVRQYDGCTHCQEWKRVRQDLYMDPMQMIDFGAAMAVSAAGDVLAVKGRKNKNANGINEATHVRVLKYMRVANFWQQMGQDLVGGRTVRHQRHVW